MTWFLQNIPEPDSSSRCRYIKHSTQLFICFNHINTVLIPCCILTLSLTADRYYKCVYLAKVKIQRGKPLIFFEPPTISGSFGQQRVRLRMNLINTTPRWTKAVLPGFILITFSSRNVSQLEAFSDLFHADLEVACLMELFNNNNNNRTILKEAQNLVTSIDTLSGFILGRYS